MSGRPPPTGGNTSGPAKPVPRCFTKGPALRAAVGRYKGLERCGPSGRQRR
ncbi:hypothetical protein APY03_2342 [Variovorax sp. WDL1]|nr:hypothetical protein APY03_2342 [Variovorax sp. WDL1]